MQTLIQGKVYKFGDNINSDIIIPGRYLIYIEPEQLAQHAFEVLGDGFPDKLRRFDVFVAGRNFGCGSAREQAATAIIGLGVKAIVACSFARTFYRNAINSGLIPGPRMRVSCNAVDILGGHEDAIGYNPAQHVLSNADYAESAEDLVKVIR